MRGQKVRLCYALTAILCTGCFIQSLNPFYTRQSVVTMPQLPGNWQLVKELGKDLADMKDAPVRDPWTIVPRNGNKMTYYLVTACDKDNRKGTLKAVFFSVGGETYCDIMPVNVPESNKYVDIHLYPLHSLAKVELKDDVLTLRMMSRKWLQDAVKGKEVDMELVRWRQFGPVVSSVKSEVWIALLEKYGKIEGVFMNERAFELKRVKDAQPPKEPPSEEK